MVISWPKQIKPSDTVRSQFHHVVDIVPTLYDILEITPPKVVNGHEQMPFDGVSLAYTFDDADAPTTNNEQFFDNFASRGIYQDGWMACTFGPLIPWDPANNPARMKGWDSETDVWELYDVQNDFSQANDLAASHPDKLAALKARFMELAEDNKDLPIGGAIWTRIHPEDVVKTPYTQWKFTGNTRRMPEFTAPGLGKTSNMVEIDFDVRRECQRGAVRARRSLGRADLLHGRRASVLRVQPVHRRTRYNVKSKDRIPAGKHTIIVDTTFAQARRTADGHDERRWDAGRQYDDQTVRAGSIHGQRNVRCRCRPRFTGFAAATKNADRSSSLERSTR